MNGPGREEVSGRGEDRDGGGAGGYQRRHDAQLREWRKQGVRKSAAVVKITTAAVAACAAYALFYEVGVRT